jgi:hypothetical protein
MSLPTQLSINSAPLGYCTQSIDTKIDADLVRFHLYRQRTTIERLMLGAKYKQSARQLSLECLRQSFPELTAAAFAQKIAHAWLQAKCPVDYVPPNPMSWNQDPTAIAALLAQILNTANIPYYITGGVTAIAHGEPRATIDLDVVISIDLADLPTLAANFEAQGFYVAGLTDVLSGSLQCLNITHLETIENVDLMISGREEYDLIKFVGVASPLANRKRLYTLPGSGEVAIASPEDVIISKLIWRRESQSDKQWRDILGVLKVQQEKLDFGYLQGWVERFGIEADWQRAKVEAGIIA